MYYSCAKCQLQLATSKTLIYDGCFICLYIWADRVSAAAAAKHDVRLVQGFTLSNGTLPMELAKAASGAKWIGKLEARLGKYKCKNNLDIHTKIPLIRFTAFPNIADLVQCMILCVTCCLISSNVHSNNFVYF